MKVEVKSLANKKVGEIELSDEVFGLEPRADLIARAVNYQLANRRAGTHKVKGRSEVSGTSKKPWRQKGTGNARAGSLRAPQFRGGGVVFGPTPRDHGFSLNKKVRKLALKTALSTKAKEGKLIVIDDAKADGPKTKALVSSLSGLGVTSAVIVAGQELDMNFALASRNIPNLDVLPSQGANVYDIIRRDTLILTKDAVAQLEERLK
ncbi:MAG: 50S ribosomal protein L4 [Alphaproteobacteria bacterium]|nr:50S ribosomal protein L4 [Alphaproteobacteria bacterium SS10]